MKLFDNLVIMYGAGGWIAALDELLHGMHIHWNRLCDESDRRIWERTE